MTNFKCFTLLALYLTLMSILTSNTALANQEDSIKSLETVLNKHKGKVIYLDFWASWCVPCRQSFPWMNTIEKKYQSQGFTIISVNLDANQVLARQFLSEHSSSMYVIYDPKGKVAKRFAIRGMPTSILIDREGQIKKRHTGFFPKRIPEYEQDIEELLE